MSEIYARDFETFLAATNEKAVLLGEISAEVDAAKPLSILDIGAGNGDLSIPLASGVSHYTAVEQNPLYVEKLRASGITVVEGSFPIPLPESYDFILASHVLSHADGNNGEFVDAAWSHLNDGGKFLVITFEGEEDDWTALNRGVGIEVGSQNREYYNALTEHLRSLGELDMRKVETFVRTKDIEHMLAALAFVASNGDPERRAQFMEKEEELRRLLEADYKDADGFFFPFQHFFLRTEKL